MKGTLVGKNKKALNPKRESLKCSGPKPLSIMSILEKDALNPQDMLELQHFLTITMDFESHG